MPIEVNEKQDLKTTMSDVTADGKITPDESDRAVAGLSLALKIIDKQEERESSIKAEYEDKLKEKDGHIVKVMGMYAAAVVGQLVVNMGILGINSTTFLLLLASVGIQIVMGMVYFVLKEKAPGLLIAIRKATDIVKPMLDPAIQAGIDTVEKKLDEVMHQVTVTDPNLVPTKSNVEVE